MALVDAGAGGIESTIEPWPTWPAVSLEGRKLLDEVADSGVWAISARGNGAELQATKMRREFAEFVGRGWCVETDHGTSALVASFEALGLGPGDEVIVPDLTWVACATSVLQVGATPVLVDVEPGTLCMSARTVRPAITARTKCVLVVHLACTAADMGEISRLAAEYGLWLVEDCAQVHGARWRDDRAVGSDGDLAIFSMQNGKALSAGEGGAVVGDDRALMERVESARADTRQLCTSVPAHGEMYLRESGTLIGANYCLTEFGSALVRDGLRRLPAESRLRQKNASVLDERFRSSGFRTILVNPELALRGIYEYGVFLEDECFRQESLDNVLVALTTEVGFPIYAMDTPIHSSRLFVPSTKPRFRHAESEMVTEARTFPVAERSWESLAMFHHSVLLAETRRMNEITVAFEKVRERLGSVDRRTVSGHVR